MGLWSKITSSQTASATRRTTRDHERRNREIRRIDAGTATWLRNGGIGPRKDR
ncbi:hypothetical protein ACPC54_23615 [Kitasatospora sp. NPDC094028]